MIRTDAEGMVLWRRAAVVWSVAGLSGCVVVTVLSFATFVAPLPMTVVEVLCGGAVIAFVITVVGGYEGRRRCGHPQRPPQTRMVAGVPVPADVNSWIMIIGSFLAIVSLASAVLTLPGVPEVLGARYVFDNHGTITDTTAAGYRQGVRATERLMTSIPAVFYLVALVTMRRLEQAD